MPPPARKAHQSITVPAPWQGGRKPGRHGGERGREGKRSRRPESSEPMAGRREEPMAGSSLRRRDWQGGRESLRGGAPKAYSSGRTHPRHRWVRREGGRSHAQANSGTATEFPPDPNFRGRSPCHGPLAGRRGGPCGRGVGRRADRAAVEAGPGRRTQGRDGLVRRQDLVFGREPPGRLLRPWWDRTVVRQASQRRDRPLQRRHLLQEQEGAGRLLEPRRSRVLAEGAETRVLSHGRRRKVREEHRHPTCVVRRQRRCLSREGEAWLTG
jgi:hypothetical protein